MAPIIIQETKQCTKCGQEFPATYEFWHKKLTGFQPVCKKCARENLRYWRKNNPQKNRDGQRRWREANHERMRQYEADRRRKNPEKMREYGRRYRITHREKMADKSRRWANDNRERMRKRMRHWYEANRAKVSVTTKRWRSNNLSKVRAYAARRRARLANAIGNGPNDVSKMYANQKGRCWYCLIDISAGYHVDHRIPLSRGGSNHPSNLVLACPNCNLSKHDKLPHEWSDRLL